MNELPSSTPHSPTPPLPHPSTPSPLLGTLYGIGVGPGDPDLITVKALKLIQSAPVVAFPAGLRGQPGVAQRILADWLNPSQHTLPLDFPYVQDSQQLTAAWHQAATQVLAHLRQGQDVVFASEGDVSFYSTFSYLAQTVLDQQPDITVHAVPGICSPLAAAAVLGLPLTLQSQRLAIIPALYAVTELETALTWADVLVLMKVNSVYREVWAILERHQLLDRSYVVQHATRSDQVIYAGLSHHPDLHLPYFSLLLVQVRPIQLLP